MAPFGYWEDRFGSVLGRILGPTKMHTLKDAGSELGHSHCLLCRKCSSPCLCLSEVSSCVTVAFLCDCVCDDVRRTRGGGGREEGAGDSQSGSVSPRWAWVLQDALGIAFCLYMLKTVRLPTFKVEQHVVCDCVCV